MISFDFEFYQPTTLDDAISLFQQFKSDGKNVMYYGGGTEFISRARRNEIYADVVIDLKKIPECYTFEMEDDDLVIGSTVTLSKIADENIFPLLADVCRHIATRTARNKITIGGNIASNLPYKEALLALLVADSELLISSPKGEYRKNINEIFEGGFKLKRDEFIIQIMTKKEMLHHPYYHFRRTPQSSINYPVLSMACLSNEGKMNVAFSGLCSYPFRSLKIEKVLNESIPFSEKFNKITHLIPANIADNFTASREYRLFVFEQALKELMEEKGMVS